MLQRIYEAMPEEESKVKLPYISTLQEELRVSSLCVRTAAALPDGVCARGAARQHARPKIFFKTKNARQMVS